MERQDVIKTIKNAIDGKGVGYTEFENWFYTSSEGAFIVDVGFLNIDCRGIAITEDHIELDYVGCKDGRKKQIKLPLDILLEFSVDWCKYF